ncbi:MAG: (2Fe-2S)-binding protein [Planctomycetes bacterium]|nr:(2Fe-2S)-binding protein [Planctomycetota bacterium]
MADRLDSFQRCYCTGVLRAAVLEAIRVGKCATIDELRRATGVCFGCQTCLSELEQLLREEVARAQLGTERIVPPA